MADNYDVLLQRLKNNSALMSTVEEPIQQKTMLDSHQYVLDLREIDVKLSTPQLTKRGSSWTLKEDETLMDIMNSKKQKQKWADVADKLSKATKMPLKSTDCVSQHWLRVLNPEIERKRWSPEEDEVLRESVALYGINYKKVSEALPGRTPIQCRYRWGRLIVKDQKTPRGD